MLDPISENLNILEGKIDHFEDKNAIIILADGQKISWPIKNLPDDCLADTPIRLILTTSKNDEKEREKIAKTILNEILKNPDGQNNQ
ncbi:MAG: hypothetical protein WCW26_04845 [Candidatus Buchananbacteria bacterium]